jgi:hypothetical protein
MIAGVLHHSFSLATLFGSASSADNFHDLAEVIEFLIRLLATLLSSLARYADDFSGVVPRRTLLDRRPEAALEQIYAVTHTLGVPIAKVAGPTTSLVFIGTAIDTVRMIAFIPPAKLAAAIADFILWQTRMFATQKRARSNGSPVWCCGAAHTSPRRFVSPPSAGARIRRRRFATRSPGGSLC